MPQVARASLLTVPAPPPSPEPWTRSDPVAELLTHLTAVREDAIPPGRPLPAGDPAEVLDTVDRLLGPPQLPGRGIGEAAALRRLAIALSGFGVDLRHPRTAAHLQAPSLPIAAAADALVSLANPSVDTYDSGPSGVAVERWVVRTLAGLAGLGPASDGVLTPGGSLSNLLGLLLARDTAAARLGINTRQDGLAALPGPVVFCSELAHFSLHRACAALGLGEAAVHPVPVDRHRRMRPEALVRELRDLPGRRTPVAVVATAGTTDFGSVDPLPELAEIAADHDLWLHVDAAHGFGTLFSERLSPLLAGITGADSITGDLHKLGWQPAPASVLLVADGASFAPLSREVAYLNPSDDAAEGFGGLLGHTLQTTRRPDAVKIATSLLAYGRARLGAMVDHCHDLANHARGLVAAEPRLELLAEPTISTLLFRYLPTPGVDADAVNAALRRDLLRDARALVGRSAVTLHGAETAPLTSLKLTLINPAAATEDLDAILAAVLDAGERAEAAWKERYA
ncbi:aminotransferase class V-fold PLP-dependent enzyme [Actinoalloteichus sp. AHMU CJ021]|uniref:pyridoxal phosphate-dependent decarboxylase family protein n=1 Tax=Actinoalloteichus TaxID=65496 RepID=UPI0004AB5C5B|nr:pyridoxal-dependent decarboxylase [Actinoalloteichus caeruleus]AUS77587.1 aminotransferase class V-fold PLP-dependent enzyme [Actinoalloteichus sp. AHMU CJ021]